MNQQLATYSFGHNLEKIRYPYLASIASCLALTRQVNGTGLVYFAICDCDDDTEISVQGRFGEAILRGELKLVYFPWKVHHSGQVEVANFLLDQIGEQALFALKLDADEVLHEESFDRFEIELGRLAGYGVDLARPHYTHLLDEHRDFDFIYRSKAVISRTSAGLRYADNDACALGGAREMQTGLEVFHFGKWSPGREREALYKEITFTEGYADLGFPDPTVVAQVQQGYLDYDRVFEHASQHGEVRQWTGSYPKFVMRWVMESLARREQFQLDLAAGNIPPLDVPHWWAREPGA